MALHVATYGDGPRYFMGIHGWGSNHHNAFKEIFEHLPEDITFFGVDMPGYGKSPAPAEWSWEAIHAPLAETIQRLVPGERISLIGSCAGMYHSLALGRLLPERIHQQIMLEPFAYMPWYFNIFLKPVMGRALYKMVFDNPLGKVAAEVTMRRQKIHNEYDMVGAFSVGQDVQVPYEYLRLYGEIPDHLYFEGIPGPVRIIHGANTFEAVHESVDLWRQVWPNLEVVTLEGTGHMITQEAPAETAAAIFAPPSSGGAKIAAAHEDAV